MEISDEDMKAMALIEVGELPLTEPQKKALGKIIQSIRGFLARVQEQDLIPAGKSPLKPIK